MNFKQAAIEILKSSGRPLQYREITKHAIKRGFIKSAGKTPWATMNAILSVDIKNKRNKSAFIKVSPGILGLNPKYKEPTPKVSLTRKPINEEFVKKSIVIFFSQNGWKILKISSPRGKGVDIKAQKGRRYFFIETKGTSELRQTDEGFVYALGQVLTRMKVPTARYAYNYGIGVPTSSAEIAAKRLPWKLARLLTLYIFSVSADGKVKRYSPKDLRKIQNKV